MAQSHIIIRGLIFIFVLIVVIVIIIMHSYKIWNGNTYNPEAFSDLTLDDTSNINMNKNNINNIINIMKQQYPHVDTTLDNYGLTNPTDLNSPMKIDATNLDAEYQVKFIQELQNNEITNLEDWLSQLKERAPENTKAYDSNTVKSVKHIPTGKLFGVLKNPNQVGPQISIIIDSKNATCIKHLTNTKDVKDAKDIKNAKDNIIKNIDLTACDYNPIAPGQKFILETVTNNSEFNNMLNDNERNTYSVSIDYGFGVYPFSVIKTSSPINNTFDTHVKNTPAECITLDNSGLSIEPCTGKESQRFTMTDIPVDLGI